MLYLIIVFIILFICTKYYLDDTLYENMENNIKLDEQGTYNTLKYVKPYNKALKANFPTDSKSYDIASISLTRDITHKDFEVLLLRTINDNIYVNYHFIDVNRNLTEDNKRTWKNRVRRFNPNKVIYFGTISSPDENVNKILAVFLDRLNKYYKYLYYKNKKVYKFNFEEYFIYKYYIDKVRTALNVNEYRIYMTLFKNSSLYANTVYMRAIIDNNIVYIIDTKTIGSETIDNLLLPDYDNQYDKNYNDCNLDENDNYDFNDINNNSFKTDLRLQSNNETSYQTGSYKKCHNVTKGFNVTDILKKHKSNQLLENKYICFNKNNDLKDNIINVESKGMCESKYDYFGRPKEHGVWDKVCSNNNECKFYKSNNNYNNNFGKCNNGDCEYPVGVKKIGHRHHTGVPLCYNCKSNKWNPETTLGTCCDKQKNKDLYPFLNSPDYAFNGDQNMRNNHYNLYNK